MIRSKKILAVVLALALPLSILSARPAQAYIDLAPTLSKVISEAPRIVVVEVVSFDRQQHTVVLKEVTALKGAPSSAPITHDVAKLGVIPRQISQWATPGARGVMFATDSSALVCVGEGWYPMRSLNGVWKLAPERPDLPLAYYGSVSGLTTAVKNLVSNHAALITVVAFGADNTGASFDLALNRPNLPGLARVQRMRIDLSTSGSVAGASANPANFIGLGAVDVDDLPALLEKLKSPDAMVRAEAVEDIRSLGKKAKSALPDLVALLGDKDAQVRVAAASAVLKLTPENVAALDVLAKALAAQDLATRKEAARATGYAGAAARPLVDRLAAMVSDTDEGLRVTAIQAITLLGPVADKAVPALLPLLDTKEWQIDSADALGRIGVAARPALPQLTKMLSSDSKDIQWAAVRAMSQIGGPDAHPAVEYMIKAFPTATEVEGYNMMIYLALLGHVAADAVPTIQTTQIKNPVLPSATQWAIAPESGFPWQIGMGGFGGRGRGGPGGGGPGGGGPGGGPGRGFGGPGGPGGGGGGGGGFADLNTLMYSAYVKELGPRLAPLSKILASKIMDNTAGDIPEWGYDILNASPEDSLAILVPKLADAALANRERAAVALGYMGSAAAPARDALTRAMAKAEIEKEKRLIAWTLRRIEMDE